MDKIATSVPVSQQMIDEANKIAHAEGWDTLEHNLQIELARFLDSP